MSGSQQFVSIVCWSAFGGISTAREKKTRERNYPPFSRRSLTVSRAPRTALGIGSGGQKLQPTRWGQKTQEAPSSNGRSGLVFLATTACCCSLCLVCSSLVECPPLREKAANICHLCYESLLWALCGQQFQATVGKPYRYIGNI